jgi:hypothetical protein
MTKKGRGTRYAPGKTRKAKRNPQTGQRPVTFALASAERAEGTPRSAPRATASAVAPAPRTPFGRNVPLPDYRYVGRDLKRIALIAGTLLLAIVVLAIVLR